MKHMRVLCVGKLAGEVQLSKVFGAACLKCLFLTKNDVAIEHVINF